jgi:hypothetical protein
MARIPIEKMLAGSQPSAVEYGKIEDENEGGPEGFHILAIILSS